MEEKYIKLSDAKKAIMDYIAEQTVSKYGSLEACMDAKFSAKGTMNELDYIPAADVVPESEVERLKNILHSYALQYGTVMDQHKVIEKVKAEVAREIFEEIEDFMIDAKIYKMPAKSMLSCKFAKIKKKYTEDCND